MLKYMVIKVDLIDIHPLSHFLCLQVSLSCVHACVYGCMCVCMLNHFSCVWLCVALWTVAYQAPLSMGFSRQEYWSGFPCPPPRDLLDSGIESTSLRSPALVGRFSTTSITWEIWIHVICVHVSKINVLWVTKYWYWLKMLLCQQRSV